MKKIIPLLLTPVFYLTSCVTYRYNLIIPEGQFIYNEETIELSPYRHIEKAELNIQQIEKHLFDNSTKNVITGYATEPNRYYSFELYIKFIEKDESSLINLKPRGKSAASPNLYPFDVIDTTHFFDQQENITKSELLLSFWSESHNIRNQINLDFNYDSKIRSQFILVKET